MKWIWKRIGMKWIWKKQNRNEVNDVKKRNGDEVEGDAEEEAAGKRRTWSEIMEKKTKKKQKRKFTWYGSEEIPGKEDTSRKMTGKQK